MAILTYLQSLNATHLFTFDNVGTSKTDDEGDSSTPTKITSGSSRSDALNAEANVSVSLPTSLWVTTED